VDGAHAALRPRLHLRPGTTVPRALGPA